MKARMDELEQQKAETEASTSEFMCERLPEFYGYIYGELSKSCPRCYGKTPQYVS